MQAPTKNSSQYRLDLKTGQLTFDDGHSVQQPRPPPTKSSTPTSISHTFNPNNDEFIRKLIDAVRSQPCLYNPNHENYGNKHSSSQFRANIWQKLCDELEFAEGPQQLQVQWKRIRDRYVRERKKRKALGNHDISTSDGQSSSESPTSTNLSAAVRHYDAMRWIDEFLVDAPAGSNAGSTGSATTINLQQQNQQSEIYYMAPPENVHRNSRDNKPLMHASFQPQTSMIRTSQNSDFLTTTTPNTGVRIKDGSTNGSPGSTTSEISVGSTAFNSTQPQVVMSQHQHSAESNIERRILYNVNKHLTLQGLGPSDESHLIVPGPSSSQIIKKDPHERSESVMTMIIDPGHLYQHSNSQKMYRLVTSDGDLNGHHMHQVIPSGSPPRKKKLTGPGGLCQPTSQHLPQRSQQLGDEILIDELGDTIVIEQSDRLMLDPSHVVNGGETMLVHHNTVQQPHIVQQTHGPIQTQNATLGSGLHPSGNQMTVAQHQPQQQQQQQQHMRQIIPIPQNRSAEAQHHHYLVAAQTQLAYDPESALINTIISHLANLNDDEKVVTKMNIQRILMDARFGRGACVRMFREEEMNELVAANMEASQQQQQQQQTRHVQNTIGQPGSSRR